MNEYVVYYEPIENNWWLASIPSINGCLIQAATLRQAKKQIRKTLSLFIDNANEAKFIERILSK